MLALTRILKIKRPGEQCSEAAVPNIIKTDTTMFGGSGHATHDNSREEKPNFLKVNNNELNIQKAEPAKTSFFGNSSSDQASGFFSKPAEKQENSANLFFNKTTPNEKASTEDADLKSFFSKKVETKDTKSLFFNNNQSEVEFEKATAAKGELLFQPLATENKTAKPASPEKKPSAGLFVNPNPGSLFSNTTAAPQENNKSFFGSSNQGGFFSGATSNEKKADEPKKGGLFDNLLADSTTQKTSFFGDLGKASAEPVKTKSGLFDGLLNPSASNNTGCGANLFGNTNTPLSGMFSKTSGGGEDEDDEAVDDNEEEVPGQELVSDPSKVKDAYKYESKTEILFSDQLLNFKADKGMGAGHFTIERMKDGSNPNPIVVFRNGTKVVLFQGFIFPGKSRLEFMKGRQDAFMLEVGQIKEGKLTRLVVKMQFNDEKAAANAKKTIDPLLQPANK